MDITDRLYQKLEKMDLPPTESHNVKVLIKQAIAAGLACNIPTNPLEGYSNLTAAIKAGDPINWEELHGRNVKCVNPDVGTNRGRMVRDRRYFTHEAKGWWSLGMDDIYIEAFCTAWESKGGWTLWIEGEIPMRRKTADQLKIGTYFRSSARNFGNAVMYVGNSGPDEEKSIHFTPSMTTSGIPASEWVVVEELGTFQKPEENKK